MWTWDPGVEIGRFRGGHGIQGVETGRFRGGHGIQGVETGRFRDM